MKKARITTMKSIISDFKDVVVSENTSFGETIEKMDQHEKSIALIVDGKNTEWSTPLTTDSKGDSVSQNPQDLKALYYATDDTYLYFMIEFHNKFSRAYHTGVQVDTDTDGKTDFIFFIIYDHLYLSIWEKGEWVESVNDPKLLKGATVVANQVIEFRIPKRMRLVQFPSQFKVWAYEFSVVDEEVSDQLSSSSVSLDQNPKKGTNPHNPDTDGDGIADGEDPDPLAVTSLEEAAEEEEEAPEEAPEEKTAEEPAAEPEVEEPEETQEPEAGLPNILAVGTVLLGVAIFLLARKLS